MGDFRPVRNATIMCENSSNNSITWTDNRYPAWLGNLSKIHSCAASITCWKVWIYLVNCTANHTVGSREDKADTWKYKWSKTYLDTGPFSKTRPSDDTLNQNPLTLFLSAAGFWDSGQLYRVIQPPFRSLTPHDPKWDFASIHESDCVFGHCRMRLSWDS